MAEQRMTYREFYPYYLKEHSNPINRTLHFVGTFLVLCIATFAFYTKDYYFFWFCPLAGYGFAWIGHFFLEKNKPATFKYPLFSLFSDFRMFFDFVTFQLGKKMKQ